MILIGSEATVEETVINQETMTGTDDQTVEVDGGNVTSNKKKRQKAKVRGL